MAMAKPRVEGGNARPPVKCHGGLMTELGSRREEERKTSHRLAKPPIWKSKMATVRRTSRTLGVVKTEAVDGRIVFDVVWDSGLEDALRRFDNGAGLSRSRSSVFIARLSGIS